MVMRRARGATEMAHSDAGEAGTAIPGRTATRRQRCTGANMEQKGGRPSSQHTPVRWVRLWRLHFDERSK